MDKLNPVGLPLVEVPNQQVASSARQFQRVANFLCSHLTEHQCVLPLLMVAVFGIELFLKCLNSKWVYHQDQILSDLNAYMVTSIPLKKGHVLTSLYDSIDRSIKIDLQNAYKAKPIFQKKATIQDALADFDELFTNSRYSFEDKKHIDGKGVTEIIQLLNIIGDQVSKMPNKVYQMNEQAD